MPTIKISKRKMKNAAKIDKDERYHAVNVIHDAQFELILKNQSDKPIYVKVIPK